MADFILLINSILADGLLYILVAPEMTNEYTTAVPSIFLFKNNNYCDVFIWL